VTPLGPYAYLVWLLAWSLPIVAGQWLAFPGYLGRTARRWLPLSLGLGVYFGIADAVGIASGVWQINQATTLGVRLGGVLPFEEALFFILTTLMVAQTTMLFLWRFGDVPGEPWLGWHAAFGRGLASSGARVELHDRRA
jgi:lycopene cyclase domain-containing protein